MAATDSTFVHRGDRGAETVIYIPSAVRGSVTVTGAATMDTVILNRDGSRIAYVAPTGRLGYGVTVGSPGTALIGTVRTAAVAPVPPISEQQAREVADQAISQAQTSSNPMIARNAALASTLGTLLLGPSDPAAS